MRLTIAGFDSPAEIALETIPLNPLMSCQVPADVRTP
jgi:hypothetical protein